MIHLSKKTWVLSLGAFLLILFAVFIFWQIKERDFSFLRKLLGLVPATETKTDFEMVLTLADSLFHTGGKEKIFLILFQNNFELRPGGGFIGSFGILKVRDGQVTDFAVHDTGNFDGRIPDTIKPPYPIEETLNVHSWKLRDSNYSPDFPENARQAEMFYRMGNGEEQFDGVVGITTNVLASVLKVTGPVEVPGFPGTYGADNAALDLEYQVEQGYRVQDIDFGERKSFMGDLGNVLIGRIKSMSLGKQYSLFQVALQDLHKKDIQIFFKDSLLQDTVEKAGWSGALDTTWQKDYLTIVDANLGAYKSDYYVKRSYTYLLDLRPARPQAHVAVTYHHTGEKKTWLVNDYQSFLRIYTPKGSFLNQATNTRLDPVFGDALNKKYFGALIQVPLAGEKTVTFDYTLPENIDRKNYDLEIQKQAGLNDVPVHLEITKPDGNTMKKDFVLNEDTLLSELP